MYNNVMNTEGGIQPFRFWCQTVLPLVYDDSLSYYELLNKVVAYLNEMADKIKYIDPFIGEITQQFNELKEYVDNFVDNLDIVDVVDDKITELINNGTLASLTNPSYFSEKNIVCYGDSTITAAYSYINKLDNYVHCNVTNRGIAGTRMYYTANNGTELISQSTDLGDFDVITLSYGTNEWQTNETPKQIYTSVNEIIAAIRAKNPNIEIVFILPPYSKRNWGDNAQNVNTAGLSMEDVMNVISFALAQYNVHVVDFYHNSASNIYNVTHLFEYTEGDIYVHPTDDFHTTLALQLASANFGSRVKSEEFDVLATYDFFGGQVAFSNTDYNNAGGLSETGLFLHYGGAYTDTTTYKTILSQNFYRIKGKTSTDFSLSCGTWSLTIEAGYFDTIVTGIPTGFTGFTLTTTADTVIEDFHIYNIVVAGKKSADSTRFGARCALIKAEENITPLTGRYAPSLVFYRDRMVFDFAGFTVDTALEGSEDLFIIGYGFPSNNYIQSYIYAVKSSTGDVYPLLLYGNKIRALKAMPTGTYIISDDVTINRNISVINA